MSSTLASFRSISLCLPLVFAFLALLGTTFPLLADETSEKPSGPSKFTIRQVVKEGTADSESLLIENPKAKHAEVVHVQKKVLIDGTALKKAAAIDSPQGWSIYVEFNQQGAQSLARVTRELLNQRLAIVIDGKLLSAPIIRSEISGGFVQISGNFSEKEAKAFVDTLNAVAGKR